MAQTLWWWRLHAGGHPGFSREELSEYEVDTQCVSKTYKREKYETEIRGIIGVVKEFAGKYKKRSGGDGRRDL